MSSFQELEFLTRNRIGQPDPSNSRFTPGAMLIFMNNAVEKIAFDCKDLRDEFTVNSIVGQEEYTLPERTLCVHWVRYDSGKIYKRDPNWLSEHYPKWPSWSSGTPRFYYHKRSKDHLRSIALFQKPTTANLEIRIGVSLIPTPVTDITLEPQINKVYHRFVIPIVASMCETDMGNSDRAKTYMTEYTDAVKELGKLSQEADDDGPVAFSPGNPLVTQTIADINQDVRFWI